MKYELIQSMGIYVFIWIIGYSLSHEFLIIYFPLTSVPSVYASLKGIHQVSAYKDLKESEKYSFWSIEKECA